MKFKYKDRVNIVGGFYKGCSGFVEEVFLSACGILLLNTRAEYLVTFSGNIFKKTWIGEEFLELRNNFRAGDINEN